MVGALPIEPALIIEPRHIQSRPRLPYLDGLRGFAALFVLLHHVRTNLTAHVALPPILELATRLLELGHYPVAVFIVVSGFSLMLPVAASPRLQLNGSLSAYLLRRARRILPAYYVVLCALLALAAIWPTFRGVMGATSFQPGAIAAHVGLVHNLHRRWCYAIDPPMWSVATEAQIYLLFPTMLLPMFRRFGGAVTVVCACSVGIGMQWCFGREMGWVCPWYLGLFAMGMSAAMVLRTAHWSVPRQLWAALAVVALLVAIVLISHRPDAIIAGDVLIGAATAGLLAWCATLPRANRRPVVIRSLESSLATWLGDISYSLYLVHFPIIAITGEVLRTALNPSPLLLALLLPLLAVPLSVAVALVLRRQVEERCLA